MYHLGDTLWKGGTVQRELNCLVIYTPQQRGWFELKLIVQDIMVTVHIGSMVSTWFVKFDDMGFDLIQESQNTNRFRIIIIQRTTLATDKT